MRFVEPQGPARRCRALAGLALSCLVTACATRNAADAIATELAQSFEAQSGVMLDRLQQSPDQALCSEPGAAASSASLAQRRAIERAARDGVRFPSGAPPSPQAWLGDWRRGERIAQSGVGLQTSDRPGTEAGGNCYGCHRLAPTEIAYGTLGPSLTGYGLRHPPDEAGLRDTWIRLFDSHAFDACSVMPRFGARGILSEEQLRDLLALLLDPQSPVNR